MLHYKLNKSADFIFDHLTDMNKYSSIHPIINKIIQLQENKYLAYETLKFGFIPYSFTYPVLLYSDRIDKIVLMHATVMKIIKIEITFKIKTNKNYCIVDEQIILKSFLPVKSALMRIFKKQHELLFQNLENLKDWNSSTS